MRTTIFITLALIMCRPAAGQCALDWKALHERAAVISVAQAEKDVRENPAAIEKLYVLGLAYFDAHKDKLADETFARIVVIDPGSLEGLWGRTEYLRRVHELDEAHEKLTGIVSSAPDFFPAYITLGYITFFKKDFETAARLMDEVLKHDTTAVDTTTLVRAHCIYAGAKGMIAYYGGPLSKMLNGINVMNHLKIAEKLQPDNVVVSYGFGCYYLLVPRSYGKNIDKAELYFNRALKLDSAVPDIYVRLAEVSMLRGDNIKAMELIKKAAELDPKNELLADVQNGTCFFVCGWEK